MLKTPTEVTGGNEFLTKKDHIRSKPTPQTQGTAPDSGELFQPDRVQVLTKRLQS
ncbi:MAG: hypothetical protein NTW52_03820 [Planctomycetota bacterium]|nr:hypothetical protein [Planctomycetota bacterium]